MVMDPSSPPSFTPPHVVSFNPHHHQNHAADDKPQSFSDMYKGRPVSSSQDQHRHLTAPINDHKKPPSLVDVAQNLWYSDEPVELLARNNDRDVVVVNIDDGKPLSMASGREKSQTYGHHYEKDKPPSVGDFGQHKHSYNGKSMAQNLRYSDQPMELLDENDNRGVVVENHDGARPLSMANLASGKEKSQPYDHYNEKDKPILSKGDLGRYSHKSSDHGIIHGEVTRVRPPYGGRGIWRTRGYMCKMGERTGRVVVSSVEDQHRHLTGLADDHENQSILTDVAQNLWYSDQPMELLVKNDNRVAVAENQDGGRPLSMTNLAVGREKSQPYNYDNEKDKPPSVGDFRQRNHGNSSHGSQDQHRHLIDSSDAYKKTPTLTGVTQNLRFLDQPMELIAENDNCGLVVDNQDNGRPMSMANLAGGRKMSQPYGHHYEQDKPSSAGDFNQRNRNSSGQDKFQTTSTSKNYNSTHFDQFIPLCD